MPRADAWQITPASPEPAMDPAGAAPQVTFSGLVTGLVLALLWIGASIAAAYQSFGLGLDYSQYASFYWTLAANWATESSRFEPGFKLWAIIAQQGFGLSFESFMLSVAMVALGIKFWLFYQRTSMPLVAAGLYLFGFFPLLEYTQIRAAMGIAILFVGLFEHLDGRRVRAFVLFICAVLFHYSMAAAPFVIYGAALARSRFRITALVSVTVLTALYFRETLSGLIVQLSAFNPLAERYLYNTRQDESANLISVWNISIAFVVAYAIALGLANRDRTDRVLIAMGLACLFAVAFFRESIELALRLREVFTLSLVFLATGRAFSVWRLPPLGVFSAAVLYTFWYNYKGQVIFF